MGLREHYRRKVLYFKINGSDLSFTLVVAPEAGKKIIVLSLVLTGGAGTVEFKSNTTEKFPHTFKTADAALVLPDGDNGYFECDLGEPLKLTNAAALTLTGIGSYYIL